MAGINSNKISKKFASYSRSHNADKKIDSYIDDSIRDGKKINGLVTPESMNEAAAKMIDVIRSVAHTYSLPDSVMELFDAAHIVSYNYKPNGIASVFIGFGNTNSSSDLGRESLYPQGYPDGVDNIIALFNNGYKASGTVYGMWRPHGSAKAIHVKSKQERPQLDVIADIIRTFNSNYSSDYNCEAVAGDDYK